MPEVYEDGFSTIVIFSENPNVVLKEKTVTPPGLDGGGPIDTTTMRNTRVRTQAAKHLYSVSALQLTAAFGSGTMEELKAMLQVHQTITVKHPDDEEKPFRGFIDKVQPGERSEGEQPTVDITVEACNTDDEGDESEPSL